MMMQGFPLTRPLMVLVAAFATALVLPTVAGDNFRFCGATLSVEDPRNWEGPHPFAYPSPTSIDLTAAEDEFLDWGFFPKRGCAGDEDLLPEDITMSKEGCVVYPVGDEITLATSGTIEFTSDCMELKFGQPILTTTTTTTTLSTTPATTPTTTQTNSWDNTTTVTSTETTTPTSTADPSTFSTTGTTTPTRTSPTTTETTTETTTPTTTETTTPTTTGTTTPIPHGTFLVHDDDTTDLSCANWEVLAERSIGGKLRPAWIPTRRVPCTKDEVTFYTRARTSGSMVVAAAYKWSPIGIDNLECGVHDDGKAYQRDVSEFRFTNMNDCVGTAIALDDDLMNDRCEKNPYSIFDSSSCQCFLAEDCRTPDEQKEFDDHKRKVNKALAEALEAKLSTVVTADIDFFANLGFLSEVGDVQEMVNLLVERINKEEEEIREAARTPTEEPLAPSAGPSDPTTPTTTAAPVTTTVELPEAPTKVMIIDAIRAYLGLDIMHEVETISFKISGVKVVAEYKSQVEKRVVVNADPLVNNPDQIGDSHDLKLEANTIEPLNAALEVELTKLLSADLIQKREEEARNALDDVKEILDNCGDNCGPKFPSPEELEKAIEEVSEVLEPDEIGEILTDCKFVRTTETTTVSTSMSSTETTTESTSATTTPSTTATTTPPTTATTTPTSATTKATSGPAPVRRDALNDVPGDIGGLPGDLGDVPIPLGSGEIPSGTGEIPGDLDGLPGFNGTDTAGPTSPSDTANPTVATTQSTSPAPTVSTSPTTTVTMTTSPTTTMTSTPTTTMTSTPTTTMTTTPIPTCVEQELLDLGGLTSDEFDTANRNLEELIGFEGSDPTGQLEQIITTLVANEEDKETATESLAKYEERDLISPPISVAEDISLSDRYMLLDLKEQAPEVFAENITPKLQQLGVFASVKAESLHFWIEDASRTRRNIVEQQEFMFQFAYSYLCEATDTGCDAFKDGLESAVRSAVDNYLLSLDLSQHGDALCMEFDNNGAPNERDTDCCQGRATTAHADAIASGKTPAEAETAAATAVEECMKCGVFTASPEGECAFNEADPEAPAIAAAAAAAAAASYQASLITTTQPAVTEDGSSDEQNGDGERDSSETNKSSGGGLPIMIIAAAAGAFLVIIILVALFMHYHNKPAAKSTASGTVDRDVVAFENPMYASPTSGLAGGVMSQPIYDNKGLEDEEEGLYDEPAFAQTTQDKSNPIYQSTEDLDGGFDDDEGTGYLDVGPDEQINDAPIYDNGEVEGFAGADEDIYGDADEDMYGDADEGGYLDVHPDE